MPCAAYAAAYHRTTPIRTTTKGITPLRITPEMTPICRTTANAMGRITTEPDTCTTELIDRVSTKCRVSVVE